MFRRSISFLFVAVVGLFLVGCGGEAKPAEESVAEEVAEKPAKPDVAYNSEEDPDAFYSLDDVEMVGSYLSLNFRDLTDNQANLVIHRLRTELSTCNSGLTIDECRVNRPNCSVAFQLAKQVIREAKIKG